MGIGMNFICSCCDYDTGMLMLNQGNRHDIPSVISQFINTYSNEIDLKILPQRKAKYQAILSDFTGIHSPKQSAYIYTYQGCVCYRCQKTYEMLDILSKKAEQVYVGNYRDDNKQNNPLQELFEYSHHHWVSLLGARDLCLFCDHSVVKLNQNTYSTGITCPKCLTGKLESGDEFQLWD